MTCCPIGLAAVSALLLSMAPDLRAQASPESPPTRVRLVDVTSGRPLVTGALTGRVGDTLFIRPDSAQGEPQRYSLTATHRFEHSVGSKRRTLEGFGAGLLFGAMAGALIGAASHEPCALEEGPCLDFGRSFDIGMGVVVFSVPSAIIGSVVGYNTFRETWRPVRSDRTRLSLAPHPRGGLRVAAAVTF
jgi:hypothetical protein